MAEARALGQLFGDGVAAVPVTAPKGSIGHVLGAAGAIEAVISVLAIQGGVVFATPGDEAADPELLVDLVVGEQRSAASGNAIWLSTNLAFGGANAALVIQNVERGNDAR